MAGLIGRDSSNRIAKTFVPESNLKKLPIALGRKLFVSIVPFECNVKSNHSEDLRIMGEVAKFEYDCFAHYSEVFDSLPEFNNKATSPKYSKTIGRGS